MTLTDSPARQGAFERAALASVARHDPLHCLTPGLFRSLRKGQRKTEKLDIRYNFGGASVRFWGPEPLGVDDMRVLQGLVALATSQRQLQQGGEREPLPVTQEPLEGSVREPDKERLLKLLEPKFDADLSQALVVRGSYRALAKVIGYEDCDSGAAFKALRACVERLWAVSVVVERDGRRQGFRILSEYASELGRGTLTIALNPRLAQAIVGAGQYYRLDMREVRLLTTDCARLLHQRLHWANPGQSARVSMNTLCSYVWPEPSDNAQTMKSRRKTVKQALANLQALGWTVQEPVAGQFLIVRPAATLTA